MLNKTALLTKNKFVRSVFVVASGTAGAQAIGMALTPFITRIYGPEAFGLLGTFTAVISVLTPMAALTYPIAIVLPKKDVDAFNLIKLSLIIATCTSSLVLLVIAFWGQALSTYFNAGQFAKYLWFIPIAMLFSACYNALSQWIIRKELFKLTAKIEIIQSFTNNLIKVGAGFIYPFGGTLILIQTTAQAVSSSLLFIAAKSTFPEYAGFKEKNENKSLRQLAYQYRDFAVFRAPEVTINAASQSLPILMLVSLFGPASAGFYTLGRSILGLPSSLIGAAIGNVFYPHITKAANDGQAIYPLIKKATLVLFFIGCIPFGIIMIFGPLLFTLVFGTEWTAAGEYSRWLAIWLLVGFTNNPSIKAIPIIKAQGLQLVWTIITLGLRLGSLVLAYYFFKTEISAIATFSVTGAVTNTILILIILYKSKRYDLLKKDHPSKVK